MKLNELQYKVITRLAGSSDGKVLVSILEDMCTELRDMRNLKEVTKEEVGGHLLACSIIELELINRLNKTSISDTLQVDESYT